MNPNVLDYSLYSSLNVPKEKWFVKTLTNHKIFSLFSLKIHIHFRQVKEGNLVISTSCHFFIRNYLIPLKLSYKKRRLRIVTLPLLFRTLLTIYSITIPASMSTRVIHANVNTLHTATFFSLSGIFLHIQLISDQLINLILIYTSPMPDSIRRKDYPLCAGI